MGNGTDTISNLTAFIDPNSKISRIYKNYNETSYTTIQEAIEGEWTSFDTNSYNTHIIGTLVLGRSYSCIIHKPDNKYGTVLVSVYTDTGNELYFGSVYGGIWVWKKVINGITAGSWWWYKSRWTSNLAYGTFMLNVYQGVSNKWNYIITFYTDYKFLFAQGPNDFANNFEISFDNQGHLILLAKNNTGGKIEITSLSYGLEFAYEQIED